MATSGLPELGRLCRDLGILEFKSPCHFKIILLRGVNSQQCWVSATTSTEDVIPLLHFPGQKPQLGLRSIDHSFFSPGCVPSVFSILRKMGCTALVGMGKRVIPFQAGSWCRQECKGCGTRRANIKEPRQHLLVC